MFDIEIDTKALEVTICKLETDHKNVDTIIKYVNQAMKTLDESRWYAREKDIVDSEFMPYLQEKEDRTYISLEKYTKFLRKVISLHQSQEQMEQTQMENTELGDLITINKEGV